MIEIQGNGVFSVNFNPIYLWYNCMVQLISYDDRATNVLSIIVDTSFDQAVWTDNQNWCLQSNVVKSVINHKLNVSIVEDKRNGAVVAQ